MMDLYLLHEDISVAPWVKPYTCNLHVYLQTWSPKRRLEKRNFLMRSVSLKYGVEWGGKLLDIDT